MPYDPAMAGQMREGPGALSGPFEKHMSGGPGFFPGDSMICGVGGVPPRGRRCRDAFSGVVPMEMSGRRAGGFMRLPGNAFCGDIARRTLTGTESRQGPKPSAGGGRIRPPSTIRISSGVGVVPSRPRGQTAPFAFSLPSVSFAHPMHIFRIEV